MPRIGSLRDLSIPAVNGTGSSGRDSDSELQTLGMWRARDGTETGQQSVNTGGRAVICHGRDGTCAGASERERTRPRGALASSRDEETPVEVRA